MRGLGLQGFPAYKAGMTHIVMVDDSTSPTANQEVSTAATILEAPPLYVYGLVVYEQTQFGLHCAGSANAAGAPKQLLRTLCLAKKPKSVEELEKRVTTLGQRLAEVRALVSTQPWKSGLGKKTPEVFEMAVSAPTPQEQFQWGKNALGKELKAGEVLQEGEYVDAVAVTTGKGWQGVVKRFGVALGPHKATKSRRTGGSLGGETQGTVMYTIPRPGQMGYHRRTDPNKRVLKLGNDSKDITPAGGFLHYGVTKTDYIILKGSVPGPVKRMILLRKSMDDKPVKKPDVRWVSQESKQK
jgi:large subunit ribosomal protein L3